MRGWNTDAQFAHDLSEQNIFLTHRMSRYLDSNDSSIIVAPKGMGKTLLLRYKRHLLSSDYKGQIIIPENSTADYVRLPYSLSKRIQFLLEDSSFWLALWELSIVLSVFLHYPHRNLSINEKDHLLASFSRAPLEKQITQQLINAISGKWTRKYEPSYILSDILSAPVSNIHKLQRYAEVHFYPAFSKIVASATYIFIDSLDQELGSHFPENLKIWEAGQHGLIKAAWEISRRNRHVKVFTAVRQEAYSSYSGEDKNEIRGAATFLEYSEGDLQDIFKKSILVYEGIESTEHFLGTSMCTNIALKKEENPIAFINRNLLPTPRWWMILGDSISNNRKGNYADNNGVILSRLVRQLSLELVRDYLISEMKIFFPNADPNLYMNDFFGLIGTNVLSLENLQRIEQVYKNKYIENAIHHPFCMLYNLGLLGVIVDQGGSYSQSFNKPWQFKLKYESTLPISKTGFFVIHPALYEIIYSVNPRFSVVPILTGDGLHWSSTEEEITRHRRIGIFISYSHADSVEADMVAKGIKEVVEERSFYCDIWIDKWKLLPGEPIQEAIEEGLTQSDVLVFLISISSLASEYVNVEWRTMFNKKLKDKKSAVIPVVIDDTKIERVPLFLQNVLALRLGDFENLEKLSRQLGNSIISLKQRKNV